VSAEALSAAKELEEQGAQFVTLMNADGLFYYLSQSHVEYYGYTMAEMVGHHLREFLTPKDLVAAMLVIQDGELNSQSIEVRLDIIAKDGHLVPIKGSARRLDEDGEPLLLTHSYVVD
jgi:PAS domain S-box-containing protein